MSKINTGLGDLDQFLWVTWVCKLSKNSRDDQVVHVYTLIQLSQNYRQVTALLEYVTGFRKTRQLRTNIII